MSYKINNIVVTPAPGSMASYLGSTDPSGWVIANGIIRTDNSDGKYNGLAALSIGTGGSGTSNYTPPDLRAVFLRGIGTNSVNSSYVGPNVLGINGVNTANGYQLDNYGIHNHSITDPGHTHSLNNTISQSGAVTKGDGNVFNYDTTPDFSTSSTTNITVLNNGSDTETRPNNIGINWIIKL